MMTIVRSVVGVTAVVLFLVTSIAMAQFSLPLRGMIESVDNQTLLVKARDGTMMKLRLTDDVHVFTLNRASFADVKRGSLVGITAKQQMDGSQKAAEIYIFMDERMHEPWSREVNSSVLGEDEILSYIEGPVLTNGDQALMIKYKESEKKITVPANVRVVTLVQATAADVKAGQYFFAPNGRKVSVGMLASTIIVGNDGADFAM
jgi:hypothetical protein